MNDAPAPHEDPVVDGPREIPPGERKARWFRHLSASSLGIEIALTIIVGWWAGRWVERNWTHWSPWTTYIGFFIGCGAGVMAIRRSVREYRTYLAELEAEKREAADHRPNGDRANAPGASPHS